MQRFCAERFHKDNVETYDPQLKNFRLDWKNPVELPPMEIETNKGNLLSHETVVHARNFWSGLEDKTLDGAAAAIRNLQDSSFKDLVLRTPVNNIEYFPPNFEGLVLGCIDADFCK